jgi:transposase
MIHVGLDLHQKSCYVHALDDVTGEVLCDQALPSERTALLDCLQPFRERGNLRVVLEACGFAGYWSDVLDPLGEVVALHPKYVAPYREGKRKNDRRDAALLTKLSRLGELPRAYLGTTAERDLKDLLRYRVGLVRLQTRLRVRLRNVAQRYGTVLPAEAADSPKARALWAAFPLRPTHRLLVEQMLALLTEMNTRLAAVEAEITARAERNRTVELLDSLPGLGIFGALLVAAEIGDWRRFPSGKALACFAGLIPSEQSSGGREKRGKITKEGSTYLRWMMVQAALHYEKSPRLRRLYERVLHRSGPMCARVAVAREMLVIGWNLLHSDRPYEERPAHEGRAPRRRPGAAGPGAEGAGASASSEGSVRALTQTPAMSG